VSYSSQPLAAHEVHDLEGEWMLEKEILFNGTQMRYLLLYITCVIIIIIIIIVIVGICNNL
jgi:hypothetical protein